MFWLAPTWQAQRVGDFLVNVVEPLFSSPWIYPISWVFCLVDAFLPIIPSETVVITSGVFASAGKLNMFLVIAVAAGGAFMGDCISYFIGRFLNRKFGERLWRTPKRKLAHDWALHALERRGGAILIVARFIPGGRTATTLTAGGVGYSRKSFVCFAAIAAMVWGIYAAGLGMIGGVAFEDQPLLAVLLGIGISLVVSLIVEIARRVVNARKAASKAANASDADKDRSEMRDFDRVGEP